MAISPERVRALAELHGRVEHVKSRFTTGDPPQPQWEVVLRKPKRAEYKAFRAAAHGPAVADALETLVRQIMVEPEAPEAKDALIEEWPGLPEACDPFVQKLTGLAAEQLAK